MRPRKPITMLGGDFMQQSQVRFLIETRLAVTVQKSFSENTFAILVIASRKPCKPHLELAAERQDLKVILYDPKGLKRPTSAARYLGEGSKPCDLIEALRVAVARKSGPKPMSR